MDRSSKFTQALPKLYGLVNRAGLTERAWFKALYPRAYFLYKRFAEDPFHALAQQHPELFSGGHILDVGANIGYTTAVFASALGERYQVHSFEPEEQNVAALRATITRKGLADRVRPHHSAVGGEVGTVEVWFNAKHRSDHRIVTPSLQGQLSSSERRTLVPITTLDAFIETHVPGAPISFVKVDVQGFEVPVLRGSKALLAGHPETTYAYEYHPAGITSSGFEPEEVLRTFREAGFSAYEITRNGSLIAMNDAMISRRTQGDGYIDLLFRRG